MTITNKTAVTLRIMGCVLNPKESHDFPENIFNTIEIHSEIGSCVITTEYSKRFFENFGKLVAKEGRKKNENGMKNIIVTSVD